MARTQHVSVNTVKRACEDLQRDGLITSKQEKGFFVAPLTPEQKQAITNQRLLGSQSPLNVVDAVEKRRMEEELTMARQIQVDLLPKELPNNEYMSLATYSAPSRTIGGDFYDYLPIDENRCGLVIADGCGKGLPAAMIISQIQAMLKSELNNGNNIQRILENVNRQVVRHTTKDKFVTLFFDVYNLTTGEFDYSNAGHNYPILVRKNGQSECLLASSPALGLVDTAIYETGKERLDVDDILLFFTDGVTETLDAAQEMYGEERLLDLLVRNRHLDTQGLVTAILEDLHKFNTDESLQDDCTIMVLKAGKIVRRN